MDYENRKCGALWQKESPKGTYFSGEIVIDGQKTRIVVFKARKLQDKEPDYHILKARENNNSGL